MEMFSVNALPFLYCFLQNVGCFLSEDSFKRFCQLWTFGYTSCWKLHFSLWVIASNEHCWSYTKSISQLPKLIKNVWRAIILNTVEPLCRHHACTHSSASRFQTSGADKCIFVYLYVISELTQWFQYWKCSRTDLECGRNWTEISVCISVRNWQILLS
jgi:hypothetical protein